MAEPSYAPAAETVQICRDLIGIDTTNYGDSSGPGERDAAEYMAAKLDEVGIQSTVVESEPRRTSVVAHWGNQKSQKPGLLIHGHLDVVPAEADQWQLPPFAAEITDGYLYGRGAIDMKDFDAMLLSVVRARQRSGFLPDRPITLAFTADEEAGGAKGAHWLARNHPDLFDGCTEAIGEVGGFSTQVGGQRLYLIESGEKGIGWMRLTASGTSGHGSMRQSDSAIHHLSRALVSLAEYDWPEEIGPTMDRLMSKVRELTGTTAASAQEVLEHFGPAIRMIGAGIRNTTNPTVVRAGYKHNVVPGSAEAFVDGRYLPGYEDTFLDQVQNIVGSNVAVEPEVMDRALEHDFHGDLVDTMTLALHSEDPHAHIAPFLMSGGTDAKAWSTLGITSYGFTPLRLPPDLDFTALFHGVDERVPVDALEFGSRVLDNLLSRL